MSVATAARRMANSAMVTGALLASSAVVAHAQPSALDFVGGGGNVSVRFIGALASDVSILSYKIGGSYNDAAPYIALFNNNPIGGTLPGTQANIGPVAAGTVVYFRLQDTSVPNTFYSGAASRNLDNTLHVSLGAGSGTAAIGGGTYTTAFNFEDRFNPPADMDYNDLNFEIANTSVVPEPSTYVLMASGLLALGVAARRRRSV